MDNLKATELRIGNYIDFDDLIIKIYSIEGFFNIIKYIDICKPIPLTEEWLIKFGFELDEEMPCILFSNKVLSTYKQDGIFWLHILDDIIELSYVHQLQNLYFALTQKELIYG